jgi:hypothetical protein
MALTLRFGFQRSFIVNKKGILARLCMLLSVQMLFFILNGKRILVLPQRVYEISLFNPHYRDARLFLQFMKCFNFSRLWEFEWRKSLLLCGITLWVSYGFIVFKSASYRFLLLYANHERCLHLLCLTLVDAVKRTWESVSDYLWSILHSLFCLIFEIRMNMRLKNSILLLKLMVVLFVI